MFSSIKQHFCVSSIASHYFFCVVVSLTKQCSYVLVDFFLSLKVKIYFFLLPYVTLDFPYSYTSKWCLHHIALMNSINVPLST